MNIFKSYTHCEYTKCHWIAHFKVVNFMLCEFYHTKTKKVEFFSPPMLIEQTSWFLCMHWVHSWLSLGFSSNMEMWYLRDFVWDPIIFAPSLSSIWHSVELEKTDYLLLALSISLPHTHFLSLYNLAFTCAFLGTAIPNDSFLLFDKSNGYFLS